MPNKFDAINDKIMRALKHDHTHSITQKHTIKHNKIPMTSIQARFVRTYHL